MKKSLKLIVALQMVFLLMFLVACGDNQDSKSASEETKESSNEPEQTDEGSDAEELDVLKVGVAGIPEQMDPAVSVGNESIRIHYNVFETLLSSDEKNNYELKPMLAEKWERVDDQTVRVELKQGIKFHNGDEMTAKDIEFSFNRLKEDIEGIDLAQSLLSIIEKVTIIDDYTVEIVAEGPDPILEERIASTWGSWIVPADYIQEVGNEQFAKEPIGTGPYKVVSHSPDRIELERFEEYWGEKPVAKRVEFISYPETSPRITALITGEVDIVTQLPLDQVSVVESEDHLRVEGLNITNMHVLTMNTQNPALKDKKVRQALSLAIDRQLLVDTLWDGQAVVPQGHQFEQYGDYYFDDYGVYEYDPEKAKKLIEESTYDGELVEYELRPGYYTFSTEAAEAIVDMWSEIGVNAQVKFADSLERDAVSAWSNTMRFPDPAGGLWLLWGPGTAASENYWQDMSDEFIAAGEELTSITDEERRKEIGRTLMEIWDEEVPGTPLYYPYENWGVSEDLEWEPYPSQAMDFRLDNLKVK